MLYNLLLVLRLLEQQEIKNKSEMDELLPRVSSLQEENRSLALDKANLTSDMKRMEAELELVRQANRFERQDLLSFSKIIPHKADDMPLGYKSITPS